MDCLKGLFSIWSRAGKDKRFDPEFLGTSRSYYAPRSERVTSLPTRIEPRLLAVCFSGPLTLVLGSRGDQGCLHTQWLTQEKPELGSKHACSFRAIGDSCMSCKLVL